MGAIGWLIKKDLLRFLADRNGAILAIVTPVVLAAILGSLFAPRDKATELALLVVDQDQTEASARLIRAIDADEALSTEVATEADARRRLSEGDASLALVLPPGTGKALTPFAMFGGESLPVTLLHDPSRKTEADLAAGLLTKIIMQDVGSRFGDPGMMRDMFLGLKAKMVSQDRAALSATERAWVDLFDAAISIADEEVLPAGEAAATEPDDASPKGGLKAPLALHKEAVTAAGPAAGYNSYSHNFAGMLIMFLLFWALDAGKELIAERDQQSLLRVRLAPIRPWQILAARGLSASLVAGLMATAVYATGMVVFGVRVLGSWPGFVLMLTALCLFIGGVSVLLAGIAKTERQVANAGTFAVLIMCFLGGATFPAFLFPNWVQQVGRAFPTWWSSEGLAAATWRGLSFQHTLLPAGVLLLMAALCFAIGALRWSPD